VTIGRLVSAAVLASLFVAAPARAATVELRDGTLRYVAADGERNQVVVTKWIVRQEGDMTGTDVSDDGAQISPGAGCTGSGSRVAHCDGPVTRIVLLLGDGNDWAQTGGDNRPGDGITTEVHAGPGDDQVHGGYTASVLYGEDGDDSMYGGAGDDLLDGGAGQDDLYAAAGDDIVLGRDGVDIAWGGPGSDRLDGGADMDELFGFNSWATGASSGVDGNDTLTGGDGPDYLDGEQGSDDMSGGADVDTLRYLGRPEALTVTLDGWGGDGAAGEGDLAHADIENLIGGRGDDVLVGNGQANAIDGYEGADVIVGGGGKDQLKGDDGADRIYGGAAPLGVPAPGDASVLDSGDTLFGDLGPDFLNGAAGRDEYYAGEGDDTIDAREPADGPRVGQEHVDCGVGVDGADLDGDDAAFACERADRTGRPAGEQPDPEPRPGGSGTLVLEEPRVSVRRGVVAFRITCQNQRSKRCRGKASATLSGSRLSLARRAFTVVAGRRQAIKLKLTSRARSVVKRRGRVRARATVSVQEPGAPVVQWARTIVIKKGSL
jgi:Ca2+-binding RTX toxin-like protein